LCEGVASVLLCAEVVTAVAVIDKLMGDLVQFCGFGDPPTFFSRDQRSFAAKRAFLMVRYRCGRKQEGRVQPPVSF